MSTDSFWSRLHPAGCPFVTSTETADDLRSLVLSSNAQSDRDNILHWILDQIVERLEAAESKSEDKENVDEAPPRKFSLTPPPLADRLTSVGVPKVKQFLDRTLDEDESVGIWKFLVEEATAGKGDLEEFGYDDLVKELDELSHDPASQLGYTCSEKLVPRDVEKDFPAKFKKLVIPSLGKMDEISNLVKSQVEQSEKELDLIKVEETERRDPREVADELGAEETALKQLNAGYDDCYRRSIPTTDMPEPCSFGSSLTSTREVMSRVSEVLEARGTISRELVAIKSMLQMEE